MLQAVSLLEAGGLVDRIQARLRSPRLGYGICVLDFSRFCFVGECTPYWFIHEVLCVLGIGFALFASRLLTHLGQRSRKRYVGVASATLATIAGGQDRALAQEWPLGVSGGSSAGTLTSRRFGNLLTSVCVFCLPYSGLVCVWRHASYVGPGNEKRRTSGKRNPASRLNEVPHASGHPSH
jgi:hypothetical protein